MDDGLRSAAVSPEIPEEDRIYDWLVGSWKVTARDYHEGGFTETPGEWHFFRALEGRAVQDVWICPSREHRYEGMPREGRYGTSIRFYHPDKVWRVVWINPVSGTVSQLVASRVGKDIVQTGIDEEGRAFRWVFSEITDPSCRWSGERLVENEWTLEAEFFMTRQEPSPGSS